MFIVKATQDIIELFWQALVIFPMTRRCILKCGNGWNIPFNPGLLTVEDYRKSDWRLLLTFSFTNCN